MKNITILTLFSVIFLFSALTVSSQASIYTPVGQPSIEEVNVQAEPRSGADIEVELKNIGDERGSFEVYAECNNGFNVDSWWRNTIEAGDEKVATISVYGEGHCSEMITCTVIAESFSEKRDEEVIVFENDCSLCGSYYEVCAEKEMWCEGGNVYKCDAYCTGGKLVKKCNEGCKYNDDEIICKEDSKDGINFVYLNVGLVFIFLIVVIFILLFKLSKK